MALPASQEFNTFVLPPECTSRRFYDESMTRQAAAWWGFHYGINGGMEGKADLLGMTESTYSLIPRVLA